MPSCIAQQLSSRPGRGELQSQSARTVWRRSLWRSRNRSPDGDRGAAPSQTATSVRIVSNELEQALYRRGGGCRQPKRSSDRCRRNRNVGTPTASPATTIHGLERGEERSAIAVRPTHCRMRGPSAGPRDDRDDSPPRAGHGGGDRSRRDSRKTRGPGRPDFIVYQALDVVREVLGLHLADYRRSGSQRRRRAVPTQLIAAMYRAGPPNPSDGSAATLTAAVHELPATTRSRTKRKQAKGQLNQPAPDCPAGSRLPNECQAPTQASHEHREASVRGGLSWRHAALPAGAGGSGGPATTELLIEVVKDQVNAILRSRTCSPLVGDAT